MFCPVCSVPGREANLWLDSFTNSISGATQLVQQSNGPFVSNSKSHQTTWCYWQCHKITTNQEIKSSSLVDVHAHDATNISSHMHHNLQFCQHMSVTQNGFTCRHYPIPTSDIVRFKVVLGIHHLHSVQDMQHAAQHLSRIVRHPQYLGTMNDIALLRLTQPVGYSVTIRPICLPPAAGKRSMSLETQFIINLYLTPVVINMQVKLAHRYGFSSFTKQQKKPSTQMTSIHPPIHHLSTI